MLPQLQILQNIRQACKQNDSIAAAMLFGSITIGELDQYSDIDMEILINDDRFDAFDKRQWLEKIAPVAMVINHEYGFDVVLFENLIRGEFHFDKLSNLERTISLCRERTRFPSLESTIVCDKTGILACSLPPLVGEPFAFGTSDKEAQDAMGRFINWFVFGINLLNRGEYAHSLDISWWVQRNLVYMARILENKTERWLVPMKFLERDLSAETYKRLVSCTSGLDANSLRHAYRNSWNWAMEMLPELADRHNVDVPDSVIEVVTCLCT